MEPSDFRWSALARYHDAALESGVILLALARCPVHSDFDFSLLSLTGVRAHVRIMTEIQQFSINARKAIEIADLVIPGVVQSARQIRVHEPDAIINDTHQGEIHLCSQSFWWIASRIIHSVSTMVWGEHEYLGSTQMRIYSQHRNEYFFFSSDRDNGQSGHYSIRAELRHCIRIEDFLKIYSWSLSRKVEESIKALRPPLKFSASPGGSEPHKTDADDQ